MNKHADQPHSATPEQTQVPQTVPVKSAKDAINAMYASDASNRLSSYLANSAKEIINATSKPSSDHKSAANLHGGSIQRSMESARPSAAGLLRQAKAEPAPIPDDTSKSADPLAKRTAPVVKIKKRSSAATAPKVPPVVHTSLKLGPKRTPLISRSQRSITVNNGMRPTKTSTPLSRSMGARKRNPSSVTTIIPSTPTPVDLKARAIKAAAQKSIRKVVPSSNRPAQAVKMPKRRGGLMQDVVRPVRPAPAAPSEDSQLPADSVKHRFRAAPRGYATTQAPANPQFASYMGDERPAPQARPPRKQPAVEIYGMMDDEAETTYRPPVAEPEPFVEPVAEDAVPATSLATPDNNRYALGGQSPFFLKSVNVEKRPLSDAPSTGITSEGTLYQRPSDESISKKNIYEKKPREKKPIPSKPTVIIPASRRSRAPLILLIIMTIILGTAVGALTYFCFFQ